MNILHLLFPKILPLSLLLVILITTNYSPAGYLKEKTAPSLLIREGNLLTHDNTSPNRKQLRKLFATKEEEIKYELIVKDVLRIFKWLDSNTLKPIFWGNFIRGQYCESSCQLIIEDPGKESVYKGGSFAGMSSDKYLNSILIYLNEDNSRVNEVSITLKEKYSKVFEVSKIHPMLTNKKFSPFTGAKLGSCDGLCKGGSRGYRININDKFSPRSATQHNLKIVTEVDIINGRERPRNTYKYSKEVLTSINFQLGKVLTWLSKKPIRAMTRSFLVFPTT